MIDPLDKQTFIQQMSKSESAPSYSKDAIERFYRWMYSDQNGFVQTCAFPVPNKKKANANTGEQKWVHARTFNEFREFCETHSDLWRYHVYAGVNTLSETPRTGRGAAEHIDTIKKLSFDIELAKQSYGGSTKEEVWWAYQYALAEVKYMNEQYGVWPLVVMSENGIHLHFNVDFECSEDMLYNKQHLLGKYLTQKAMNSKYTTIIESQAPEHINFDQDDVSDPARVMKVPGTRGIKSQTGRLCGIIHQPNRENAGVITQSDIDKTPDEIRDELDTQSGESTSNGCTGVDMESVDTTPSELSDDTWARVNHLIKTDNAFRQYWNGDADGYDSRSELEYAFVLKLLKHEFDKSVIADIMWASGMSKWGEEGQHYRERTIENAAEYFDGNTVKDSTNGSFSFSDR
jgi:hypothetical protein